MGFLFVLTLLLQKESSEQEVETKKGGSVVTNAFFLILGLTNGIALTADACNLGLLESNVAVD